MDVEGCQVLCLALGGKCSCVCVMDRWREGSWIGEWTGSLDWDYHCLLLIVRPCFPYCKRRVDPHGLKDSFHL